MWDQWKSAHIQRNEAVVEMNAARNRKRPDWSRRLSRPLIIPTVMTLTTLADVRTLLGHLPKHARHKTTWQYIADQPEEAARGADTGDVAVAFRMVCSLEGIPCRPK
jgi:hypothetical protein